ncbi:hypothetical protein [Pontibacter sp. G13]|uniref:hypothetical protein n=1 Tax=Pontibacter sp. G13 TaxID=3074898 RepID=UPI00288C5505|nr:hypothetical protein [Pontibacter sp. G13]WNJ17882.1 hypothetical protein RJD25_23765 [Pontibacter sp. G13]
MKNYRMSVRVLLPVLMIMFLGACSENDFLIPIPMTEQFEQNLSAYEIYQGTWSDLEPTAEYQLLELNSSLFSNYAKKQRLVKLPVGTQMTQTGHGIPEFPEGTILVKTFFYYLDARDESLGKQVIETRLLILRQGVWNVASYVWNESQTEATLAVDGLDTSVSWINDSGTPRTIDYHVPDQNECAACHQTNEEVFPLGPTMRNLNIEVTRGGLAVNQLAFLQSEGLLNDFDVNQIAHIPNYHDEGGSLAERARAYLDLNCAHCHNPGGWEKATQREFDFRFETELENTNILRNQDKIKETIQAGEMPYLGTTVLDDAGVELIVEYLDSL